jgi:hypothetical protein
MKKFFDNLKKCPLFVMIILSAAILTIVGSVGIYKGIFQNNVSLTHPVLESVLLIDKTATSTDAEKNFVANDEKSSVAENKSGAETADSDDMESLKEEDKTGDAVDKEQNEDSSDQDKTDSAETGKAASDSKEADKTADADGTQESTIATGGDNAPVTRTTKYKTVEKRVSRNSCYGDVTEIALETDYPYIKVDKSYFDDALFIGDSRVEGLELYSGLDNATFACMEGLTTFGLMTEKIANNGTTTLTDLLSENKYSKIYIMVGINEAGYSTESYVDSYVDAVNQIRELQPDAVIFMMGCMHVSSDYSDTHSVINNDNIDYKNSKIAAYADGIKLFYLDMNTVVDDGEGGLIKDYTWDDIHLQAQYYSLWENYLYERGLPDSAFK